MNKQDLITMIDYSLSKPTASKADITAFCNETIENGFKGIEPNN